MSSRPTVGRVHEGGKETKNLVLDTAAALLATAGSFAASPTAFADACLDFQSESLGARSTPWQTSVGGPFVFDGWWRFTNDNPPSGTTDAFMITDLHFSGSNSLFPLSEGAPASDEHVDVTMEVAADGAYPTEITMDIGVGVPVTITAYDASGGEIWSDDFNSNGDYFVQINNVGNIAYVVFWAQSTELWIDNICLAN